LLRYASAHARDQAYCCSSASFRRVKSLLSLVCNAVTSRRCSSTLRPTFIGYQVIARIIPSGSEAAEVTADLVAGGCFAGTEQHGDRPARCRVVDMDRQETALVVMRIEQRELLMAVNDIHRVVNIKRHGIFLRATAGRSKGRGISSSITVCRSSTAVLLRPRESCRTFTFRDTSG
jgi:hypothetical protein